MQLITLGSAAAEAIPNPFCRCEVAISYDGPVITL